MKKLVVANWKMNGSCDKITADLDIYRKNSITNDKYVLLSLPFVYLPMAQMILESANIGLVAQNVSQYDPSGAYTGEISAAMLEDLKIHYVLIGHSERRDYFNETDEMLLKKLNHSLKHNLTPIFCFGESLAIRQSGSYLEFLDKQLAILAKLDIQPKELILAYEPIWAIGTGLTATTTQVEEAVEHSIAVAKQYLPQTQLRILYGGSVSAQNAKEILGLEAVGGVLVGGASLKVNDFVTICESITN